MEAECTTATPVEAPKAAPSGGKNVAKNPGRRGLKRDGAGLTLPQRKFIQAYFHDHECRGFVSKAAKQARRSPSAYYRWLADEEPFRTALEKERRVFLLSRTMAVDKATLERASEKNSAAADKRLAYEVQGRLATGGTQLNVAIIESRLVTREDMLRVIKAGCRANKLHGDEPVRKALAEKHDVIDTEFTDLATN